MLNFLNFTDVWPISIFLILFGLIIFYSIISYVMDEYSWNKIPTQTVRAKLLNRVFQESTSSTQAVPTVTSSGVGVGIVSSGSPKSFTTVWDLGRLGIFNSDNEKVYRYSKEQSNLLVKIRGEEVRIVGIELT